MQKRFSSLDLLKETRALNAKYAPLEALSHTFDAVAKIAGTVQDAAQRDALLKAAEQGRAQVAEAYRALSKSKF